MLFSCTKLEAGNSIMTGIQFRTHRPGDIGYIIHRHGVIYSEKYGWDTRFDAYVARIMAQFVEDYDPTSERCWIAEREGDFLGCVLVCKDKLVQNAARLRVLLVEPRAQGLGLGKQLVHKCIDFAREQGYESLILSTQSNLGPARSIYKAAGFEMLCEEEAGDFAAPDSRGEIWQLKLSP